ncbi:MAG: YkgJ family cysteine cluster protein [Deltaproteobacteria bacterium]|nr:YkgJ family cysteine cluster protein [Deltaproteobacteria bacterium]
MEAVFVCQRCGACCLGQGGIVVGLAEQERICAFLGLSLVEFLETYAVERRGKVEIAVNDMNQCVFFGPSGCLIHPAKPDVCRAWPFFRGNLMDRDSWKMAQDACPGLIRTASFKEFSRLGLRYLQCRKLVHVGRDEANALIVRDIEVSFMSGNGEEE